MRLWEKATQFLITRFLRIGRNAVVRSEYAEGSHLDIAPINLASMVGTVEQGLTAHAGGGQASAYQLASAPTVAHVVSTVATAADSVKMPAATGSMIRHYVVNESANSMQLFGQGTDTINGVATGTGIAVAAGAGYVLQDIAAGKWIAV